MTFICRSAHPADLQILCPTDRFGYSSAERTIVNPGRIFHFNGNYVLPAHFPRSLGFVIRVLLSIKFFYIFTPLARILALLSSPTGIRFIIRAFHQLKNSLKIFTFPKLFLVLFNAKYWNFICIK